MSELLTPVAVVAVPVALAVGGVMLAATLIRRLVASLDPRSQQAFAEAAQALPQVPSDVLRPPSLIKRDAREHIPAAVSRLERAKLPPAEKIRVSALLSLASAPYAIENPAAIERSFAALGDHRPLPEAFEASHALLDAVRAGHAHVFTQGLVQACTGALQKIGFAAVETASGPFNEVRIIGSDAQGRFLVAEIATGEDGDPALAAEVVGVRDGSCVAIMKSFEEALAAQGVRYAPGVRKPTGGVCQLRAAQEFVRRKVLRNPDAQPVTGDSAHDAQRRAQRLNVNRRKARQTS